MKAILLNFLAFMLLTVSGMAQTINPAYQDGKIWFKLKGSYKFAAIPLESQSRELSFAALPFIEKMADSYQLTHLSRPFAAAKTSEALQRTYLLEFTDHANIGQILSDLRLSGAVEYAEMVPLDKHCLIPNDPSYSSQWGLSMINAASAWSYFSSGSNISVAIVDDAVERTHPDLAANLWINTGDNTINGIDDDGNGYVDDINGYDVGSNDNNPNPPSAAFDHGTHVAGIAGARSNNSTGVASIGFSVKLMCVKSTTSSTSVTNGYDGVVYAAVNNARVINMSWGGSGSSITAQNVIDYAYSQGCVLIAAAGNDDVSTQFYPAAYTGVISVAATTSTDAKASFSNYGSWIDVSAPGNNIFSTTVSSSYGNKSGTSMASPMVAGLAGLMLSLNPSLTQADIQNCLLSTADNINAMNPGYIGQLGSGRIDANAAMQCISTTLAWPPIAEFSANVTTVTAGGAVTFTDESLYGPATWTWSFPSGTPSSYIGATPPPITYNTPGIFNVVLTVVNPNGTDVETKTSYITVNPAGGCQTMFLPTPAGWTPVNYYTGATVGADGWINGMNVYLDKQKAAYFDASAFPYTMCTSAYVAFGRAYSANPSKIVPVRIYDGTSGTIGALLGTQNATMGQIMSDVDGGYYTEVIFSTPVTLPASKRFFVSVDLTNLQWTPTVKDTLSIVSNSNGQTVPSAIWEQQSDNLWYHYGTAGSWNLNASLYIHPFLTSNPVIATFTQSATTVCQSNSISFDATGSTFEDTLLWVFPGGTPNYSNNVSPTIFYNTPGTYTAKLYVIGGGCSQLDSAEVTITINANPNVSISATPPSICPGNSSSLVASGASSYIWSPPTGLSATTGSSVTASPTSTITYNVQGTGANGCVSNSPIIINVNPPPVSVVTVADTAVCAGEYILFDGSLSTNVTSFSWSFPGGTPTTSASSTPNILFSTFGTFTATLTVTNSCGSDNTYFQDVNVGCAGIDEASGADMITSYYIAEEETIEIQISDLLKSTRALDVKIFDPLGRIIVSSEIMNGQKRISMEKFNSGMYVLNIHGAGVNYHKKFVKR